MFNNLFIKYDKRGFTLIELLVVIAIIGILTGILLPNYIGVRQRARDVQRKTDLQNIQTSLEIYRSDNGTYPASVTCGSALRNLAGTVTYMQKVPCDPTNSGQYIYRYLPSGSTYSLVACLENVNDTQRDLPSNDGTYCTGGSTNWSFTLRPS